MLKKKIGNEVNALLVFSIDQYESVGLKVLSQSSIYAIA